MIDFPSDDHEKVHKTTILQCLPDPVVSFDAETRIIYANPAAQALFGASQKALVGVPLKSFLDDTNPLKECLDTVIRTEKTLTLHDVAIHEHHAHSVMLAPIEGTPMFMMVAHLTGFDLKTAWTNKAKTHLRPAQAWARALAHEIKNPLAGIHAAAQLLGKLDLKEDDKELVNLITKESERILRLVQGTSVFEDAPPEQYKAVNIHEVLNRAAQVARTTYGNKVQIEEKYDPSLPNLHGHFDRLVQAQLNLIKNAAEALAEQEGGKISIRTFYDNAASLHAENYEKMPLCIEIEDNGSGITPESLAKIFDPYFTTKWGGQGLGLSVVSKVVDDHGGAIDVHSKPGRTVFRISFPVLKPTIGS